MTLLIDVDHQRHGVNEQWASAFAALPGAPACVTRRAIGDPAEVRYALVWGPQRGFLARFPALEVIFSAGAGVDHLGQDPELPAVPVVRVVNDNLTARMVEWVVLQVLTHHRQVFAYRRQQGARQWRPLPQVAAERMTVGILGLGALGLAAARALGALGFKLRGWSRSAKEAEGIATFHGAGELDAFLAGTDILVALLPLTGETRGILDRALFGKLSRNGPLGAPVLINAGRGALQVDRDLAAALVDGTLLAASIDVFEHEPLPAESPLWALDNLILTPHVAADSEAAAIAGDIVDQIKLFEAGGSLRNVVDRARGY